MLKRFCIKKGGQNVLTEPLKNKIIGLTKNSTGFSGLLSSSEMKYLSKEIVTETPTIDEILAFISKGGRNHE